MTTEEERRIAAEVPRVIEALRLKRNLTAVAVSTNDGLLIGGAGPVDLELMGALGSIRRTSDFEGQTLHTSRFDVNDVELCLTCLGAPVRDDAAVGSLMRILAV